MAIEESSITKASRMIIIAAVIIGCSVIGAIAIIETLQPAKDHLPLYATLIGFATATLASIYAGQKAAEAKEHITNLAISVDGRLTKLLETTARAERAEGVEAGRIAQMERSDIRDAQTRAETYAAVVAINSIPTVDTTKPPVV
jgi:hypothetical protein